MRILVSVSLTTSLLLVLLLLLPLLLFYCAILGSNLHAPYFTAPLPIQTSLLSGKIFNSYFYYMNLTIVVILVVIVIGVITVVVDVVPPSIAIYCT